MSKPVARNLHIVANTSSSTEAFARRTNEISKFVSGIGRQNSELEKQIGGTMRLSLIRTHPDQAEKTSDGRISRRCIPLAPTIGTRTPNDIYRKSATIEDLRRHFAPLIDRMAETVKSADVVLLGGTYFVPWCLLEAARAHQKPAVLCYAGILSMEIGHLPQDMQSVLKLMEQDFYDPKLFYVFPSSLTRSTVEGIFGRKLPHSEVVYNGVPPEFLNIGGPAERETTIAFVGRNTPVKNPQFLLRLKGSLDRMHRDYPIRMVTGIDPNNRLVRELRRAGVVVLEPLDTTDLARFYRSSGVVVSPSLFETFGNVPLEAVSTGTPALISPKMGVCEVFGNLGIGGYVTDFTDPDEVAGKIDHMVAAHEPVPENVRQKIRDELSWPRVIGRYLEICVSHAFG